MTKQKLELSCEFFPPRTDAGKATLGRTTEELTVLDPEFFSVTFGAGGSTRDNTLETVLEIKETSPVAACPHLSCVGLTNKQILELVDNYRQQGINRLVVLRGDAPSGLIGLGECRYAVDLVRLIREHHGDHFTIAVAAYPEAHPDSKNLMSEVDLFGQKMQAGADFAITQYFYNNDSYFHFMELCAKQQIEKPVIPGIMPINNFTSLKKFSRQCGAEIPRWIKKSMAAYEDDIESQRQFGIEIVTRLVQELIDYGVPGLHFYTMNQSRLTLAIARNLDLID